MFKQILQFFKKQSSRAKSLLPERSDAQKGNLTVRKNAYHRQLWIVGLSSATAWIHLILGGPLFILNGLGYLGITGAHYLLSRHPRYQAYTRNTLVGYTGITVILYFVYKKMAFFYNPIGLVTKLIELTLIYALWVDRKAVEGGETIVIDVESQEMAIESEIDSSNIAGGALAGATS